MTPSYRRAFRAIVLVLVLALLAPVAAGCSGGGAAAAKPARYGSFGADFARTLAAANPARTAGSEGEKKTGDRIIEALRELGFEPTVTSFGFKAADGTTKTSRNISIRIPGTGVTVKPTATPAMTPAARPSATPSARPTVTPAGTSSTSGTRTEKTEKNEKMARQVVIGAHYDATATQAAIDQAKNAAPSATGPTSPTSGPAWIPTWKDFTGISDNASSIGALMVMARELKVKRNAHDVVLVAFGAGHADQAGARDFVAKMSADELARTDAMYNLENIYAGDKLYANAGQNSIRPDFQKDYEKRRKLYEVTDIYYEYELYSNNRVALYTNQSNIETDQNRSKIKAPYREWTTHASDHLPFDEKGIPIVFFESYDYDVPTLEAMRESSNPAFTATNGRISGTPYDSTRFLEQLFESQQQLLTPTPQPVTPTPAATTARTTPGAGQSTGPTTTERTPEDDGSEEEEPLEDLLTRRINNTAFIIVMAIRKVDADAPAVTPTNG